MPIFISFILVIAGISLFIFIIMILPIWYRFTGRKTSLYWDEKIWIPISIFLIAGAVSIFLIICWKSSCVKADMINRKFGTNYTYEEVFWGGEIITDMLEGTYERKKIDGDININLDYPY